MKMSLASGSVYSSDTCESYTITYGTTNEYISEPSVINIISGLGAP